jgi:hypothetical protein
MAEKGLDVLDLAPRKRAIARPPWEAYAIHAAPRYTCLRDCSRHDSSSLKPRWSAVGGVRQGLTAPRVDGKRCTTPGATNMGLAPGLHAVPEIQTHGSRQRTTSVDGRPLLFWFEIPICFFGPSLATRLCEAATIVDQSFSQCS